MLSLLLPPTLYLVLRIPQIQAYVPAQSSNSTSIPSILSNNGTSTISLEWFKDGAVGDSVIYQLAGAGTNGLAQGALVNFADVGNTMDRSDSEFSSTPWIAFVSCDSNSTTASNDTDVFTSAQDRGAIAAVCSIILDEIQFVYPQSILAPDNGCLLVREYRCNDLIQSRFAALQQPYRAFNASLLNNSVDSVESSIQGNPVQSGYIFATLQAGNATTAAATSPGNGGANGTGTGDTGGYRHSKNRLAMVILFTITGSVSALCMKSSASLSAS